MHRGRSDKTGILEIHKNKMHHSLSLYLQFHFKSAVPLSARLLQASSFPLLPHFCYILLSNDCLIHSRIYISPADGPLSSRISEYILWLPSLPSKKYVAVMQLYQCVEIMRGGLSRFFIVSYYLSQSIIGSWSVINIQVM